MVAKLLATELFEGMKNVAPTGNKLRFRPQIPSFVRRPEKIVTFGLGFNEKTAVFEVVVCFGGVGQWVAITIRSPQKGNG